MHLICLLILSTLCTMFAYPTQQFEQIKNATSHSNDLDIRSENNLAAGGFVIKTTTPTHVPVPLSSSSPAPPIIERIEIRLVDAENVTDDDIPLIIVDVVKKNGSAGVAATIQQAIHQSENPTLNEQIGTPKPTQSFLLRLRQPNYHSVSHVPYEEKPTTTTPTTTTAPPPSTIVAPTVALVVDEGANQSQKTMQTTAATTTTTTTEEITLPPIGARQQQIDEDKMLPTKVAELKQQQVVGMGMRDTLINQQQQGQMDSKKGGGDKMEQQQQQQQPIAWRPTEEEEEEVLMKIKQRQTDGGHGADDGNDDAEEEEGQEEDEAADFIDDDEDNDNERDDDNPYGGGVQMADEFIVNEAAILGEQRQQQHQRQDNTAAEHTQQHQQQQQQFSAPNGEDWHAPYSSSIGDGGTPAAATNSIKNNNNSKLFQQHNIDQNASSLGQWDSVERWRDQHGGGAAEDEECLANRAKLPRETVQRLRTERRRIVHTIRRINRQQRELCRPDPRQNHVPYRKCPMWRREKFFLYYGFMRITYCSDHDRWPSAPKRSSRM